MRFSKEVQIGLTVLGTLICLYVGIMYLRTRNILPNPRILYFKFHNAEGIGPSTRVFVKGFEIGQIQRVEILDSMLSEFLFSISLDRWIRIPKSSGFKIKRNLLSGDNIELWLGEDKGLYYQKGDTLPVIYSKLSQSNLGQSGEHSVSMMDKVSILADSMTNLVGSINFLIRKSFQPYIKNLMESLEQTTRNTAQFSQTLVALDQSLRNTMNNTQKLSVGLLHSEDKLKEILENTRRFSGSMAEWDLALWHNKITKIIENFSVMSGQLSSFTAKLSDKQGTLGLLLSDDKLYQNINRATTDLRLLLRDLKANPSRYLNIRVFGSGSKHKIPILEDSLQYE